MGPWSRPPGAFLTTAWSGFPAPPFSPSGPHMQFRGSQAPCSPARHPPGFPQSLICLLTSRPAHVFTGRPPSGPVRLAAHHATRRAEQSRAWHGAGALQTSVRGVTLDGETNDTRSPKCTFPSCYGFSPGGGQGTLAVGGGRGRADPPTLGGLGGPELVKTRRDRPRPCKAPVKMSEP